MLPFQRLVTAAMLGNAELRGQAAVKDIAEEQSAGKAKASITIKPNPNGGPPLVTVKDAPADLLNQTQDADLAAAYADPRRAVEEKLKSYGFSPSTSDIQPSDVDQFGERYRARRELGGGAIGSAIMAGITGHHTDAKLIRNLKNSRAAQNSQTVQKFVDPLRDQDLQEGAQAISASNSATARHAEERQVAKLYGDARNQILDQKNIMQYGSVDDFLRDASGAMAPVGGMRGNDEALFRRAFTSTRASSLNERYAKLAGPEGRTAVDAYEPNEPDRFIADQFGVDPATLSDYERSRATRLFNGLQSARTEERLTDIRKEKILGTFSSAGEARSALGVKLSPEKTAEFDAQWKAERQDYVAKNNKEQVDLQIKAASLYASQRANQIAQAAQAGSGEAAIEKLPISVQNIVKGISSGRMDITKVTSMRGGGREAMTALVAAYDPSWSTAVAPARAATFKDFYSGDTKRKAIDPLNTAIHHLDEAKKSMALLNNAPPEIWNRIKQKGLESLAGDPRYGRFVADTTLLAGEIGKLSKGGVPDKEELATINRLLSTANSPARLNAVLDEYVKLMAGRAIPLAEGFVTRTGMAPPAGLILTKSSEDVLRRRGFGAIADAISNADTSVPADGGVIKDESAIRDLFKKK